MTRIPTPVLELRIAPLHDSKEALRFRAICDERITLPLEAFASKPAVYEALTAAWGHGGHQGELALQMGTLVGPSTASWSTRTRRSGTKVVPWSPAPLARCSQGTPPARSWSQTNPRCSFRLWPWTMWRALPAKITSRSILPRANMFSGARSNAASSSLPSHHGKWWPSRRESPRGVTCASTARAFGSRDARAPAFCRSSAGTSRRWPLFSWWSTNLPRTCTTGGSRTAWSITRGWSLWQRLGMSACTWWEAFRTDSGSALPMVWEWSQMLCGRPSWAMKRWPASRWSIRWHRNMAVSERLPSLVPLAQNVGLVRTGGHFKFCSFHSGIFPSGQKKGQHAVHMLGRVFGWNFLLFLLLRIWTWLEDLDCWHRGYTHEGYHCFDRSSVFGIKDLSPPRATHRDRVRANFSPWDAFERGCHGSCSKMAQGHQGLWT